MVSAIRRTPFAAQVSLLLSTGCDERAPFHRHAFAEPARMKQIALWQANRALQEGEFNSHLEENGSATAAGAPVACAISLDNLRGTREQRLRHDETQRFYRL
jgi:hypothetical protein